jgi:DNA-binding transcriptional LysR family regulator
MLQGVRHIRAFLAVARLGSFTRAAGELHVSQPALTVQIRQLEDALRARLFDRNKRHVALTQTGRTLLGPLSRVLADLEAVIDTSRDLAGLRRGSVAVAVLPTIAAGLLPIAIRRFSADHPAIRFDVRDAVAERIVQLVNAGEVDFGIGSRVGTDSDVEWVDFLIDRMSAFIPEHHPLAARHRLTLRDVVAYPLVLTARGTSVRALIERVLAQEDLEFTVACDANYMSTAVAMVRAGLGVSVLPASAVNTASCVGVLTKPLTDAGLTRKIAILRKPERSLSPAAEQFVAVLKQVIKLPSPYFASPSSITSGAPLPRNRRKRSRARD